MKPRSNGLKRFTRSPLQLAILTLFAGASTAHAQSQPPAPPDSPKATLEQIVVTATKSATPLQQTPLAVTSISAAELDKAQVQTIVDFVHMVPSFQATTQGDHGVITMTLRGVGNDSAKTEYADPEVGVFIDGIYSPRAEGAAVLLFDMESIEVLRGPQGTLWGRNSTVGAINMQTAKPVLKQNFSTIEGGLGDYNRIGLRGAFNAPARGHRGVAHRLRARTARRLRRLPGGTAPVARQPAGRVRGRRRQPRQLPADQPESLHPGRPEVQRAGPERGAPEPAVEDHPGHHLERLVREVRRSRHARHEPDAGPAAGRVPLVRAHRHRAGPQARRGHVPQPLRLATSTA